MVEASRHFKRRPNTRADFCPECWPSDEMIAAKRREDAAYIEELQRTLSAVKLTPEHAPENRAIFDKFQDQMMSWSYNEINDVLAISTGGASMEFHKGKEVK